MTRRTRAARRRALRRATGHVVSVYGVAHSRMSCACIRTALHAALCAAFGAAVRCPTDCTAGRRLAAHRRTARRAIRRVRADTGAMSLHMACPCLRAVRRAAFGAAVQRAGVLPRTCRACGPGRVCRGAGCSRSSATGPQRPGADAEGKTKGGGTCRPAKPVCTWGWRGTQRLRRRAAWGARPAPMQGCPRASHDRTRHSFQGAQP